MPPPVGPSGLCAAVAAISTTVRATAQATDCRIGLTRASAAAYGVLTWVFQDGHGSMAVFGVPATGAITMWVPLMVFAFLFGLSMDYEVFILSRIRRSTTPPGRRGPPWLPGSGGPGGWSPARRRS